MNESDKNYGLLTEVSGIEETRNPQRQRHLSPAVAISWLREGWRDLLVRPILSLAYGTAVFLVSLGVIGSMYVLGWGQVLFPALAGFLVVGPVLAVGLYEKSRATESGELVTLSRMLFVKARSGGGQVLFVGVLLCLLMLLWMRAAVLIYALFFGYRAFPGLDHIATMLFTSGMGWAMLGVGTLVGGLFAAFAFAISAFSVPMLLNERTDALTAMGSSMAFVWNNFSVMFAWGVIVLALSALSFLTGLLGLVVAFPLLGHATWHAYAAICRPRNIAAAERISPEVTKAAQGGPTPAGH
jgi:uncharacterized membrane protein